VGEWTETVLYSFKAGSDGNSSISSLVADVTGSFYGTTSEGASGSGTIFKLIPENGTWIESIAHSFHGSPDGAFPYAGMVGDGVGTFYGATVHAATTKMVRFAGLRLRFCAKRKFEDALSDEDA